MSERTSSEIRGRDTVDAGQRQTETASAIDAFYDKAETFVSGIGRIVNVDTSGDARTVRAGHPVAYHNPPTLTASVPKALPPVRRRFEVREVAAFEVTNGEHSKLFATRDDANAWLAKLEAAGL